MDARADAATTPGVIRVLWGKSDAGARPLPLLQHLLDTAAVAQVLWDVYLSDAVRRPLDEITDGRGRWLLALLGGWHDLGKATPGFQGKVPALAAAVTAAGLRTSAPTSSQSWRHELASATIVREVLRERWPDEQVDWFWPLLAGHHGRVPSRGKLAPKPSWARGDAAWVAAQHALALEVVDRLGGDLRPPRRVPSRSRQLVTVGHLIMADWVASDVAHFPGLDWPEVSMPRARARAEAAVQALGLRRGLRPSMGEDPTALMRRRFGRGARPVQRLVGEAARGGAGLLVVEAPTGEGKTEAALVAAELLAAESGQDGVYVALPTQATSDPMFTRVHQWVSTFDQAPRTGLLHGKRALNREWSALQRRTSYAGIDAYGLPDPHAPAPGAAAAGDWFLGRKRGLLQPVAVGTVDQVLYAATRTKHVMLRHAGLAGGVVVIDEVHAYDVYMSQFLHEFLRWAGGADIPVVLLSATLPPSARASLATAYAQGATGDADVAVPLGDSPGYPSVLTVRRAGGAGGGVSTTWTACAGARASQPFEVVVLEQQPDEDDARLAELLAQRLAGGGTCLVVRNTVPRAQQTFQALQEVFPGEVELLHARLTAGARTDRAETMLRELGSGAGRRPARRVVVATQVAEQSFDIDADLLVTDLAPIDLLVQRAGRLHRHERAPQARPAAVRRPQIVVTGLQWRGDESPLLPKGSCAVYGEHLLLRAAALVQQAVARGGWDLPADVPALVTAGYARDEQVPVGWREQLVAVRADEDARSARRQADARRFVLAGVRAQSRSTLEGLHDMHVADGDDEGAAAVVRDGDDSVEVTLVVEDERGYRTLSGRRLGATGEAVHTDDRLRAEVAASSVRLPGSPDTRLLNKAAREQLAALPGWSDDVHLRSARALVLDADAAASLGEWRLRYDERLGLLHERAPR